MSNARRRRARRVADLRYALGAVVALCDEDEITFLRDTLREHGLDGPAGALDEAVKQCRHEIESYDESKTPL